MFTVKCLNGSLNVNKLTGFDLLNPVKTHVTAHQQLHKAKAYLCCTVVGSELGDSC